MAEKGKSLTARIAFTLPISCQICLGKVKEPVVCPNQHVFCFSCLEVWLERNKQCPTCRIPITEENPQKKIYGGLSENNESSLDDFSKNKEMRHARVEVIFKDYEDAIERLETDVYALKQENRYLEDKLNSHRDSQEVHDNKKIEPPPSGPDTQVLTAVTKKLQDASAAYEKVKREIKSLKKENGSLKDENSTLTRENQRLRLDLVNRSPRRYGRFTVATLENKVEANEKEITQLKRALERSDAYVEEMEVELKDYRMRLRCLSACAKCSTAMASIQTNYTAKNDVTGGTISETKPNKSVRDCTDEDPLTPSKLTSRSFYGKRPDLPPPDSSSGGVTSSAKKKLILQGMSTKLPQGTNSSGSHAKTETLSKIGSNRKTNLQDSFEFELPSPTTPSTSLSKLSLAGQQRHRVCEQEQPESNLENTTLTEASSLNLEAPSLANESSTSAVSLGSCRKKLKFDASGAISDQSLDSDYPSKETQRKEYKNVQFDSSLNEVYNLSNVSKPSDALNESSMNASMIEDIDDCMAILDAAEKKVEQRKSEELTSYTRKWNFPSAVSGSANQSTNGMQALPSSTGGLPGGSATYDVPKPNNTLPSSVLASGYLNSFDNIPSSIELTSNTNHTMEGMNHLSSFGSGIFPTQDPFTRYFKQNANVATKDGTFSGRPASTSKLESMLQRVSDLDQSSKNPFQNQPHSAPTTEHILKMASTNTNVVVAGKGYVPLVNHSNTEI